MKILICIILLKLCLVKAFSRYDSDLFKGQTIFGPGNCTKGDKFIEEYFGDCVETPKQAFGFALHIASMLAFLAAIIPQIYIQCNRGKCEGISLWLILGNISGDGFYLWGVIHAHRWFVAAYNGLLVFLDLWLIYHYFYHRWWKSPRPDNGNRLEACNDEVRRGNQTRMPIFIAVFGVANLFMLQGNLAYKAEDYPNSEEFTSRLLYDTASVEPTSSSSLCLETEDLLGALMGICYVIGKVPQIFVNINDKTTKGLSFWMFFFNCFGNIFLLVGLLLLVSEFTQNLLRWIWIFYSGICLILNLIILIQFDYYGDGIVCRCYRLGKTKRLHDWVLAKLNQLRDYIKSHCHCNGTINRRSEEDEQILQNGQ